MRTLAMLGAVLAVGLAACTAPEPFKLTGIDLTNKIDAGNHVYSPGTVFATSATIYASIATEGSGSATLGAKWLDADGTTVLAEQTQTVEQTGATQYEFHYAPDGGWEAGKRYSVVITVDGGQKRTREFEIR